MFNQLGLNKREARELVEDAWAQGGAAAVTRLKETDPAVDVVMVQKPERAL